MATSMRKSSDPHSLNLSEDQQTRMMLAQVRSNRMRLRQEICQNTEEISSTDDLMASGMFLNQRYEVLNFEEIIRHNSQSLVELERLPIGLAILEKYGRHLLRPLQLRAEQWRVIKYMNPIFAERVDTIQGGRHIIHKLGYTVELADGLSFPEGVEPVPDHLVHLVADIILARHELEKLIKGDHPNPQQLNQFLSQRCLFEISQALQPGSEDFHSATVMAPAPVIQFQKGQIPANQSMGEVAEKVNSVDSCDICGENLPEMICYICESKQLCVQCDIKWHRHPQRQSHNRTKRSRPLSNHRASQLKSPGTVPVTPNMMPISSHPRLPTLMTLPTTGLSILTGQGHSSPRSSNDSFHSTEDISANNNNKSSLDNTAESGAVMANMLASQQQQQQQQQGASQLVDEELLEGLYGGSSAAGDFVPPPLPDIFRTDSYKSPQMEMRRQIAGLDDKIEDKQTALNGLLISSPSFADDPLYVNLTREKDQLIRKKLELTNRMSALRVSNSGDEEDRISSPRTRMQSSNSQPVFYPPSSMPQYTDLPQDFLGAVPKKRGYNYTTLPNSHNQRSNNNVMSRSYSTLQHPNTEDNNARYKQQQQHSANIHPVFIPPFETWPIESCPNDNIPSGPSPERRISAPPYKTLQFDELWACEHCTTVNEPGNNICSVCYKTSDDPKFVMDNVHLNPDESTTSSNNSGHNWSMEAFEQIRSELEKKTNRAYEEFDEITKQKKEAQERDARLREEKELERLQNEANDYRESSLGAVGEKAALCDSGPKSAESSAKLLESSETQKSSLKGDKSLETETQEAATRQLYNDGKRLVHFLKQSIKDGYKFDEFDIAMTMCGNHDPIEWLKLEWEEMIGKVVTKTTTEGSNQNHNCVGELSRAEAREHLRQKKGNVNQAVESCVKERADKYEKVMAFGPFPREETLRLLNTHKGEINAVMTELQEKQLQPFLERIWENPVGSRSDALLLAATNELTVNSVIDHVDFQDKILDEGIDLERRIRMILVEGKLSWERAKAVIQILTSMKEENLNLHDVIEAVRSCRDKPSAILYLQQECQVCFSKVPMSKIENFTYCPCKLCADCFTQHLELVIREKFVKDWTCPLCQQPDIQHDDVVAGQHFAFVDMMLRALIDRSMLRSEVRDLFQEKLRDWRLMKDPNFRWCAHCGNGFIFNFNGREMKMTCSSCNKYTCFKCKKQWEPQHDGVSCEDFERWKSDNNPENQAMGLARHLDENGIVCPGCNMRYALAKGGCMHFKCPQCGHEFCCGCYLPFRRAENCNKYESCRNKGLHCHHPRDCFSYLRDNTVEELQSLLQECNIEYNTDPPEDQENTETCPVILQKEQSGGNSDEPCEKEVEENHYGLCGSHYKEYLVRLINKQRIDPVGILSVENIHALLSRLEVVIPQKNGSRESSRHYHKRLTQYVIEKVPLPRRDSTGNLEEV